MPEPTEGTWCSEHRAPLGACLPRGGTHVIPRDEAEGVGRLADYLDAALADAWTKGSQS